MTDFHDVALTLPSGISVRGGPERATDIAVLGSGLEQRTTRWVRGRRRYELAGAVSSPEDLAALTSFFEARRGRLHGFRFRDPLDSKSCGPLRTVSALDQILGTGNGATTTFALRKTYADPVASVVRDITKPVAGAVRVAVANVELAASAFSVDASTGLVTLTTPPAAGAVVSAGFLFDTPVRFDADRLEVVMETSAVGRLSPLPLIEVSA